MKLPLSCYPISMGLSTLLVIKFYWIAFQCNLVSLVLHINGSHPTFTKHHKGHKSVELSEPLVLPCGVTRLNTRSSPDISVCFMHMITNLTYHKKITAVSWITVTTASLKQWNWMEQNQMTPQLNYLFLAHSFSHKNCPALHPMNGQCSIEPLVFM